MFIPKCACKKPHFSRLATYDEIAGNDCNLSVSAYVKTEDTREKIDIGKLNSQVREIVARE
ncbi:MAG: N-6 DNA methylase [Solobacterium sp.]|nr:N-6 DNA methylase [Solobacterium sp.]